MCAALGNAATHKTVKRATRRTNEIVMWSCAVGFAQPVSNGNATGLRKFDDEFHAISFAARW
jgi:hypothetical protein